MSKIIIIAIVCLCIVGAIAFAFYKSKEQSNDSFEETYNARVDIYNMGDKNNTINIISQKPSNMKLDEFNNSEWMEEPGIGTSFAFTPRTEWKDGEIVFKAVGSGKLKIELLGAYKTINENNELEKIYADFKDVTLNNEKLLEGPKTVWHNERETFVIPSENDKVYTLKFKYKNPS